MEELSAVGEQVFDAECILNKRLRKVGLFAAAVRPPRRRLRHQLCDFVVVLQGKLEFLVKWRGWSAK